MKHPPTPRAHQAPAPEPLEDAQHYQALLRDLATMAASIARHIHDDITHPAGTTAEKPALVAAFDRAARTLRRTILLATRLNSIRARHPTPEQHRRTARTHLIRSVENAIAAQAEPALVESLRAEFRERLDCPDLEEDLETRPIQHIIDEIQQDLAIDRAAQLGRPARRTPDDLQALKALAEQPPSAPWRSQQKPNRSPHNPPAPALAQRR